MTARRTRSFGRRDRDKPAEPPEDVSKAEDECVEPLKDSGAEQRLDGGSLADRWRESHERWQRELRSSRG